MTYPVNPKYPDRCIHIGWPNTLCHRCKPNSVGQTFWDFEEDLRVLKGLRLGAYSFIRNHEYNYWYHSKTAQDCFDRKIFTFNAPKPKKADIYKIMEAGCITSPSKFNDDKHLVFRDGHYYMETPEVTNDLDSNGKRNPDHSERHLKDVTYAAVATWSRPKYPD